MKVLQKITAASGSSTTFDYNSYGQVKKITNKAANGVELNHTAINLPDDATIVQDDCPRFSETRINVKDFNGGADTVVHNSFEENQLFHVDGQGGTATKVEVWMDNAPNNLVSRTWYYPAGNWTEGLSFATEDYADNVRKRWTTTAWTQDNPNSAYIQNPRPIESKVGDEANVKRTETEYHPISQSYPIALVKEVRLYGANQTTIEKRVVTDYNSSAAYLSRRIIGLPAITEVYGLNQQSNQIELVSKQTYGYDEGDFAGDEQNISSVIQHDNTNYNSTFIVGRGNRTSTTRHDVINGSTVSSQTKYNTAGAAVRQIAPDAAGNLTREVKISYADKYNDGNDNRNTYAYPTRITTAGAITGSEVFSEIKYRFDTGANVWAKSPAPAGNTSGKETARLFDSFGRPERETLVNTGAYTRYQYFPNELQSKTFTTVTSGAGEVESETWTDGAGRVLKSRTELPNSAGGWSGSLAEYDILGQATRSTVPTEINASWQPAGDDAARGWLWTHRKYDWKGRVTREINTDGADGATPNDSDTLFSYEGCGCAGGQVTTIQSENIIETDWQGQNPNPLGRRTQKIYEDVLGRAVKTEIRNWNGSGAPYSTTVTQYNGRDQAVSVKQYAGAEGGATVQGTTLEYDGHGRLKKQHRPEQIKPDNTPGYTIYNYNSDDSISSVVDAREAATNYVYGTRGLLEQVNYSRPAGSSIQIPATINFTYDALGNRISMADGLGTVAYAYNELSQMKSETRAFSDTLANAPLPNNSFKLEYTYNLSGQLKSLKDPYGQQFNYAHDKIGRLNSVTGSTAFAGVTNYASNPEYDARGTLTALDYGNGVEMNITNFNNKLQATAFEVKKGANSIIKKQYQFYNDGSLKFSKDVNNAMFDRLYKYDHAGRTVEAKSGANARGINNEPVASIPYKQNYTYNAFDNTTNSTMEHYASGQSSSIYTYADNRNALSTYDADGNETADENATYEFDAAGRKVKSQSRDPENPSQFLPSILQSFDGAGQETKRVNQNYVPSYGTNYYIRSTVLGKIISETNATGAQMKTFIPANGVTLAEQHIWRSGSTPEEKLIFLHQDASGASLQQTTKTGALAQSHLGYRTAEFDALGNNVGESNPYITIYEPPPSDGTATNFNTIAYGNSPGPISRGYRVDGIPVSETEYFAFAYTARFGAFGLIERNARMSSLTHLGTFYSFKSAKGKVTIISEAQAGWLKQEAPGRVTQHNYYLGSENWSLLSFSDGKKWDHSKYFITPDKGDGFKYLHFKDTKSAKSFLENGLNTGNCKSKIAELLNRLKVSTGVDPITTDLLDLFNKINDQRTGGFTFNVSGTTNLSKALNDQIVKDFGEYFREAKEPKINPLGVSIRMPAAPFTANEKFYNTNFNAYIMLRDTVFDPKLGSY